MQAAAIIPIDPLLSVELITALSPLFSRGEINELRRRANTRLLDTNPNRKDH